MQHLKTSLREADCPKTVIARHEVPKQSDPHRQNAAKIFGVVLVVAFMMSIATPVFADVLEPVTPTKVPLEIPIGSVTAATLSEYIVVLHQYLVSTAAIFAVIYMMFGGYRWLFAAGNKQHVASAQDMIWTSAVGLFLALTSYILLFTLNPQTTKFPKLPIPYLSDKQLTTGSAKRICSAADVDLLRDQDEKPKEWKPTCGEMLSIKNADDKIEVCVATRSEYMCAITKNVIGEYTGAVQLAGITIRDLNGATRNMRVLSATQAQGECGLHSDVGYPNYIAAGCQTYGTTTCYYIKGEPLVNDVENDITFVKGKPQCAD